MQPQSPIEQIAERVERLLLRYEEIHRTNALLTSQVEALTLECDAYKSRLSAARARINVLLDRLPVPAPDAGAAPPPTSQPTSDAP